METEGLFTSVWGPSQWESMHNITFNYPYEPTEKDKVTYYTYFVSIGDVLPCCVCRQHYNKHISEGKNKLTMEVLSNRTTLSLWLYNLHKTVCKELGFNYDITYEMLCKKHNSYIAKCNLTPTEKMNAYRHMYDIHAPCVKYNILKCFIEYAQKRGFDNFEKNIKYYNSMDRESQSWYERNQLCQEQIKYMRINGISQLEQCGIHVGLPTIDELRLMEMTSSNLNKKTFRIILKLLGYKVKSKHKNNFDNL